MNTNIRMDSLDFTSGIQLAKLDIGIPLTISEFNELKYLYSFDLNLEGLSKSDIDNIEKIMDKYFHVGFPRIRKRKFIDGSKITLNYSGRPIFRDYGSIHEGEVMVSETESGYGAYISCTLSIDKTEKFMNTLLETLKPELSDSVNQSYMQLPEHIREKTKHLVN